MNANEIERVEDDAGLGFLVQWIVATAGGILAGVAVTFLLSGIGILEHSFMGYSPSLALETIAGLGVSSAIQGLLVGTAQWLALRQHVPASIAWIPATALGWALMAEISLFAEVSFGRPFYADTTLAIVWDVLKALMGGTALGFAQWTVLARRISWGWLWIIATPLVFSISAAYVSAILRTSGTMQPDGSDDGTRGAFLAVMIGGLLLLCTLSGGALVALLKWSHRAAVASTGVGDAHHVRGIVTGPPARVEKRLTWTIGAFIAVVIIAVGVAGFASVNAMRNPPSINISRADYEQALTKWRAQNVDAYVITIERHAMPGGRLKLRVSNGGKDIAILEPTAASTPSPGYLEYFKADTVEGMFDHIDMVLRNEAALRLPGTTNRDYYMAYTVRFHAELGYPTYLEGHPVSRSGFSISDVGAEKTVEDLTIISRNTPTPSP